MKGGVGMLEAGITLCALILSGGSAVLVLENRISTLEANEKADKEKLEYMYQMHEAARSNLKDRLVSMDGTLNNINATMGRVDERTKGLEGRLSRLEGG